MRIGIGVQGRFHAFDLARALLEAGHDVTVFTNYPAFIAKRFGLSKQHVRGCVAHGVVARVFGWLDVHRKHSRGDAALHKWFGRWLSKRLLAGQWDITYTWSSVSEEYLRASRVAGVRLLARGSAHIRSQQELLEHEEARTGVPQEHPNPLIIDREEGEYELADAVVTLSRFARGTFIERGFRPERVRLMVAGTRVAQFGVAEPVVAERCRRLLSEEPLRVLMVGTFSFQKGVHDLAQIVRALPRSQFRFRFVGKVAPEAAELADSLRDRMEFIPRIPQSELPAQYAWGDVFIFPSIQDGFAAVTAQASASGLPLITSTNGSGLDLVREGFNGWVLPIRSPGAYIERLKWCQAERTELARITRSMSTDCRPRDWEEAARDFVNIAKEVLALAPLKR